MLNQTHYQATKGRTHATLKNFNIDMKNYISLTCDYIVFKISWTNNNYKLHVRLISNPIDLEILLISNQDKKNTQKKYYLYIHTTNLIIKRVKK